MTTLSQGPILRSLSRPYYTSPTIFEQEMDNVIARHWIYFGHVSELENPGSVAVRQLGAESVLVTRDKQGIHRAFFNLCRHRGSQLCDGDQTAARALVCPYHQWTFGLDGQLIGAPDMRREINQADYGLKSLALEVWHGFIFVAFGPAAPVKSVAEYFAAADAYIDRFELENMRIAHRSTYEVKANWKLLIENFMECYHCHGSHPELIRVTTVPDRDAENDTEVMPAAHTTPGALVNSRPGPAGILSATLDGQAACQRLLGRVGESPEPFLNVALGLYPLSQHLSIFPDHVVTHRIVPVSVDRSTVVSDWLVHAEAVEGQDYDVSSLTAVWEATNRQDVELVERTQRGVNSRYYTPGQNSRRNESWIQDALLLYAKMLEDDALLLELTRIPEAAQ